MNRAVVELDITFRADPCKRVLAPVHVVATAERTIDEILAGMRTAAFLARFRAVDRGDRVGHQIVQFERFHQIGVPDHRTVGNLDVRQFLPDGGNALATAFQRFLCPEYGGIVLHGALHLVT